MKNIVLFMVDQLRADAVGYAGADAKTTNIDWISRGAHFSCCNSTNPLCTPARTSLITGRYPRQIGTIGMSGDLFPQIPTFMQALQRHGYTTYGIGKYHYLQTWPWGIPRGHGLDSPRLENELKKFGYDFVWETAGKQQTNVNYCYYCDYLNKKGMLKDVRDFFQKCGGPNGDTADHNYDQALPWPFAEEDYIDVVTARVAKECICKHPVGKPYYMMVSFCGPHKPYDAPQRYLDQFPLEENDNFILPEERSLSEEEKMRLYKQRRSSKAMVKLIDDQIGEILDLIRKRADFEDTLFLFVSDHGDMLGDHYMIQKAVPWRQAVTVPLAMRIGDQEQNLSISSPVELSDLAATILDYAGLDPANELSRPWPAYNNLIPSRSLMPILREETEEIRDFTYVESDFTEEKTDEGKIRNRVEHRGGTGRSDRWQAIVSKNGKYIRYLEYETPGKASEEYYDLIRDPQELHNVIDDPTYAEEISLAKDRLLYIMDKYPPLQMTWAPVNAVERKQQ